MLVRAIERAGLQPGRDVAISLDIAASEFGEGPLPARRSKPANSTATLMSRCCSTGSTRYPIVSIEDPFAEDDRDAWIAFTRRFAHRMQIVGDDYLTTERGPDRPRRAHCGVQRALIKPNQAGTLTETRAALTPAGARAGHDRLGALGRNRGRGHRAPRGRLERRAAQGRFVRAVRAHGQVERGAAHRRGPGRTGPIRRPCRACDRLTLRHRGNLMETRHG
jgi:hypothetical protein